MKAWVRTLTVLGILAAAGCQGRMAGTRDAPAAQTGNTPEERKQTATYRGRMLTSDLPAGVRVPAVAAAAEMALRHRGYSVKRSMTEDFARVEGEPPRAGLLERVVIRTRQTSSRTRVEIIAQPLGDQVLSRAILAEMVGALGI